MNNLRPIAQAVRAQGRGNDTQLVHMTPNEVQGLQALAKAHGGSLSINPDTGLPEAGFLDSLLPTILGAGLAAATGGSSLMIGAGLGALQFARTGSLEKGLMAGLGAYGGAGLASGLMGAGAGAAASGSGSALNQAVLENEAARKALTDTSLNAAGREAATQTAASAAKNLALQQGQAAAANTFGGNLSNMGKGLEIAFKTPSAFMDAYGGTGMDLAKYAGASVAGPMMQPPKQQERPVDNVRFEYDYSPNRASKEDLEAQRRENPYGELTYFRPSYSDRREVTVGAAQGGIMGLANGGSTTTPKFSYDPKTQTYKRLDEEILETDKPVGAVESLGVNDRSGSSGAPELTEEQKRFFEYEMPDERDARLRPVSEILSALAPGAIARALVGGLNSVTGGSPRSDRADVVVVDTSRVRAPGDEAAPVVSSKDSARGSTSGGYSRSDQSDSESGGGYGGFGESNTYGQGAGMARGGLMGLARGGALHFAEGDVVPGTRIYKEPVVTPAPQLIPAQTSQELAAAALQQQQLANQATQFVAPSAMIPQQRTFAAPQDIASGYATDYTRATPETFQAGLAALQPARKDLPGGFGGYGDKGVVRQPVIIPNVDGTFPPAPPAPVTPGGRTDTGLTQFTTDQIIDEAKIRTAEGGDFRDTLLKYGTDNNYTYEQMDEILGLPAGTSVAYANKEALTDFMPEQIIAEAQTRTSEGEDVRDTLLDYGRNAGYTNDQMDIMLGLPAGSTAAYAASVGKKKGGLLGLAAGGMAKGGFVIPADVVSALGNGSTDAGLRKLKAKIGAVQPIKGKGDGLSDSIPTNIDGKQPARVADGEAYVDPRTVARIGGGNPKKGAQKLYAMMDKVRQQAHGKTSQQRNVDHKAVL